MGQREPAAGDTERIGELVESAMTTSHRLSPQQIERIVEDEFGEDAVTEKTGDDGTIVRVVETDEDVEEETVVGYVEGRLDGDTGEVNWLFVDPEHRGKGIGTELFESMTDELRDAGAENVHATTLEANTEGNQFFERFGLERVDERRVDIGDESLVKYMYVESSEAEASDEDDQPGESGGEEMLDTETQDGTTTATTEDGKQVFVARDEKESGTEAPFFVTYTGEDHSERFGFYCSNCGSLDVSMDDTDRIECQECGNTHASRSDESYDDSYL